MLHERNVMKIFCYSIMVLIRCAVVIGSERILTDYDLLNSSINYPRGIKINNCHIDNQLTYSVNNIIVFGTLKLENQPGRTTIKNSSIHRLIINNCNNLILKNVIINYVLVQNNSVAHFLGNSNIQKLEIKNGSNNRVAYSKNVSISQKISWMETLWILSNNI